MLHMCLVLHMYTHACSSIALLTIFFLCRAAFVHGIYGRPFEQFSDTYAFWVHIACLLWFFKIIIVIQAFSFKYRVSMEKELELGMLRNKLSKFQ